MSDPLALNKILAGFLCACLILIGSGKIASFLQNYGKDGYSDNHGDHHKETKKISVPFFTIEPSNLTVRASAIESLIMG